MLTFKKPEDEKENYIQCVTDSDRAGKFLRVMVGRGTPYEGEV